MAGEGIRLNKLLSEKGICSRRDVEHWIAAGRVVVNGKRPEPGSRLTAKDQLRVDGRIIDFEITDHVYLALNKPPGIVSTTDTAERDNIISFVNYPRRIFPIGRLDKQSEGLIMLTSDGDMVNKVLRAGNNHEKEYEVTVVQAITPAFLEGMRNGVPIMGTRTKKCRVVMVTPHIFRIVLVQGMNRQIRRMCEYFHYDVRKLKRIRIMHLTLDLPPGEWRELTAEEIATIHRLTANSGKEAAVLKKTAHKKNATKKETPGGHPGTGKKTRNTPAKRSRGQANKPNRRGRGK